MHTSRLSRAVSLCLAASITLAMLGGIDFLSSHDSVSAQWAKAITQHVSQPA